MAAMGGALSKMFGARLDGGCIDDLLKEIKKKTIKMNCKLRSSDAIHSHRFGSQARATGSSDCSTTSVCRLGWSLQRGGKIYINGRFFSPHTHTHTILVSTNLLRKSTVVCCLLHAAFTDGPPLLRPGGGRMTERQRSLSRNLWHCKELTLLRRKKKQNNYEIRNWLHSNGGNVHQHGKFSVRFGAFHHFKDMQKPLQSS